jgi:hypothetical protein
LEANPLTDDLSVDINILDCQEGDTTRIDAQGASPDCQTACGRLMNFVAFDIPGAIVDALVTGAAPNVIELRRGA